MKRNFIPILIRTTITCLLSAIVLSLVAANAAFAQTEKEIVKTRAEVAAINKNASGYKKTIKDVEGNSRFRVNALCSVFGEGFLVAYSGERVYSRPTFFTIS